VRKGFWGKVRRHAEMESDGNLGGTQGGGVWECEKNWVKEERDGPGVEEVKKNARWKEQTRGSPLGKNNERQQGEQ